MCREEEEGNLLNSVNIACIHPKRVDDASFSRLFSISFYSNESDAKRKAFFIFIHFSSVAAAMIHDHESIELQCFPGKHRALRLLPIRHCIFCRKRVKKESKQTLSCDKSESTCDKSTRKRYVKGVELTIFGFEHCKWHSM